MIGFRHLVYDRAVQSDENFFQRGGLLAMGGLGLVKQLKSSTIDRLDNPGENLVNEGVLGTKVVVNRRQIHPGGHGDAPQ
jgi:hypothetical protein